jgi:hypothetical protein
MTAASENNGRPSGSEGTQGVLANLPRTRPQRSSARRTAARLQTAAAQGADAAESTPPATRAKAKSRKATSTRRAVASGTARRAPATGASAAAPKTAKGSKPAAKASAAKRRPTTPRRAPGATEEQVPLQGFESEMDRASGPVEPPGGTELVATAAEILGEIAKAGLSTGERLLRDALTRLPL